MTYQEIDQILLAKGLSTDPAFDALKIAVETIPSTNGCPLGLYYPDTALVILPPDGTEGALLHELGHRHGHYYYNDLSEVYAEAFRKIYQPKGRALLYCGNHFESIPKFGPLFEEGERGAVEVAFAYPLTPGELSEIRSHLNSYGENPRAVYYGDGDIPFLRVEFTKGIDWMVFIGSTLAGLAAATAGIMGYAIYKVSEDKPWITPVLFFGIPASILLALGLGAKYAPQLKKALAIS